MPHCAVLIVSSDRITIAKVGNVLIFTVYFLCASVRGHDELVPDISNQIESQVASIAIPALSSAHTSIINECNDGVFYCILDNNLCICDSRFSSGVKYTYCHECCNDMFWIDHFLVSWVHVS